MIAAPVFEPVFFCPDDEHFVKYSVSRILQMESTVYAAGSIWTWMWLTTSPMHTILKYARRMSYLCLPVRQQTFFPANLH